MLARFAARVADLAQRVVPDPFVIALGLTLLALLLGLWVMPDPDLARLAAGWFAQLSSTASLAFTCQMALMLVLGSTLTRSPQVAALLARLADVPRTTRGAAALTTLVAMVAALLNWSLGLVAGAVLARQIGERAAAAGRRLNYPLVGACGYVGLMVWHGGLSGSAPLKVADEGAGGLPPIPLDQTLLSPLNLGLCAALLLVVPVVAGGMADPASDRPVVLVPRAERQAAPLPGRRLGERLLGWMVVLLAVVALIELVRRVGPLRAVGLNTVVLTLLVAGLLLFGSPLAFARAFTASIGEAADILLQFPLYFGILGLLQASGLDQALAGESADAARALAGLGAPLGWSYDVVNFLTASVVNFFVPSGGGQWAVQGPIIVSACAELGHPVPRAVMGMAYGDQWTNMLQPFWALPLLAITGLRARDILGYTTVLMLAVGPLYLLAFALL